MSVSELLRTVDTTRRTFEKARHFYKDRFAPDFNPFDFIDPSEMKLSEILAWLLNPKGSHGQDERFLQLFVARLFKDTPALTWSPETCEAAKVKTEVTISGNRRIDVLVSTIHSTFAIENKAWGAADLRRQVADYASYLDSLYPVDTRLIYLTSEGSEPSKDSIDENQKRKRSDSHQLQFWSWSSHILEWLAECRAVCRADRVLAFIDEFTRYLQKHFLGAVDLSMQTGVLDEIVKRPSMVLSAFDVIFAAESLRERLLSKLKSQLDSAVKQRGWKLHWEELAAQYGSIAIETSPELSCDFKVQFDNANYRTCVFGAAKKPERRDYNDTHARQALELAFGNEKGDSQNGDWIWWCHASTNNRLFPFERDWIKSAQPWTAIPEGELAKAIIKLADDFHQAMSSSHVDQSSKPP